MSDEKNMANVTSENSQIRNTMVETAVNFLLNPTVIDKPYAHKTAFLKRKGLTDAEIALAYERAEKYPKYSELQANGPSLLPPPVPYRREPISFLSRLSNISSSLIVLGVALFGVHYVYKNYIEPYIFGRDSEGDKSKNLEEHLLDVSNSISQIDKNIAALEEKINIQKTQMDRFLENEVNEYPTPQALRELKIEIAAVKSLLLNRHQFPALPKVTPVTIPEWQLIAKESASDTNQQNGGETEHSSQASTNQASADDCISDVQDSVKIQVTEDATRKFDQNELSEKVNDFPHLKGDVGE